MTSKQLELGSYYIEENIGKGAFGIVSRILIKETKDQIYALKEIDLSGIIDEKERAELLAEANAEFDLLFKKLKNVVPAFGSFYNEKKKKFSFTMEFCPQNLFQFIGDRGNLKFSEFLPLFENIVTGLNSLIQHNVIHRDLKPANILIKQQGKAFVAYVADVGVAKACSSQDSLKRLQSITTIAGTDDWMAPEMRDRTIMKNPKGKDITKLDVFSLGLLALYSLDAQNYSRFKELNTDSYVLQQVYLSKFKAAKIDDKNIPQKEKIPDGIYYMLKCMLSFDWNTRPSVQEIQQTIQNFTKLEQEKDSIRQERDQLLIQVDDLTARNSEYKKENSSLYEKNRRLEKENAALREENEKLKEEVRRQQNTSVQVVEFLLQETD